MDLSELEAALPKEHAKKRFRIQPLPDLVHKAIFELMDPNDIFKLSILSKKMKSILIKNKNQVEQIKLTKANFYPPEIGVFSLPIPDEPHMELSFTVGQRYPSVNETKFLRKTGEEIAIFGDSSGTGFAVKEEYDKEKDAVLFREFADHIMDLFKFKKLIISGIEVTLEEAKKFIETPLEHLEIVETTVKSSGQPQNFNIKCSTLSLPDAGFLSFASVAVNPNLKIFHAQKKCADVQWDDLMIIIQMWVDGAREEMLGIVMTMNFEGSELLQAKTRKDWRINLMNAVRRSGIVKLTALEDSEGTFFILHRQDGKCASLQIGGQFIFEIPEDNLDEPLPEGTNIPLDEAYFDRDEFEFFDEDKPEEDSDDSDGW